MTALKIHRKTVYRFRQPVSLGSHGLVLRPRESRDLRLMSHTLAITPQAAVAWAHDVFGNTAAMATFATTSDMLVIDSAADILLNAASWPVFDIAASAISYPFRYADDEWTDLGALTWPLCGIVSTDSKMEQAAHQLDQVLEDIGGGSAVKALGMEPG